MHKYTPQSRKLESLGEIPEHTTGHRMRLWYHHACIQTLLSLPRGCVISATCKHVPKQQNASIQTELLMQKECAPAATKWIWGMKNHNERSLLNNSDNVYKNSGMFAKIVNYQLLVYSCNH